MTELVVIHDLGAPGGAEWRAAFRDWSGAVLAPDLPGHGGAPPPVGGHHEVGDAVYPILDLLRGRPSTDRVVLGVGRNGAVARLLALGGRASALVLVDGLGGPWIDVVARDRVARAARRRILATPDAVGPPPPTGPDPRAQLALGPTDREFVVGQVEAMPVPTLVVETPDSPTPDAAALVAEFPDATLVEVRDGDATTIAAATRRWWSSR